MSTNKEQTSTQPKSDVRKMSQDFSLKAIDLINELPNDSTSQYLSKNFLASSTSIGALLIEAKAAPSKEQFAEIFDQAFTKVNETKYWLTLIASSVKGKAELTKELLDEAHIIAKIIFASIQTLRGKKQTA